MHESHTLCSAERLFAGQCSQRAARASLQPLDGIRGLANIGTMVNFCICFVSMMSEDFDMMIAIYKMIFGMHTRVQRIQRILRCGDAINR